jgi:predicted transcriptional regulator
LGERTLSHKNSFPENRKNFLEVFAEVLDCCIIPQEKTQLISKINLSSKMMTDYLMQLKFLGLIEGSQSSEIYVTTTKGIEYLRRWAQLQEIIDPVQTSENRLVQGFNRILSAS